MRASRHQLRSEPPEFDLFTVPDQDPSGILDLRTLVRGELPSGNRTRLLQMFARTLLDPAALVTRREAIAALPLKAAADA